MTPTEKRPVTDIYKTTTVVLASITITLIGTYVVQQHNAVNRDEIPALIKMYNPYESDAKDIKNKLDDLKERVIKLDDYQKQIGQDVANIAAKAGVSAHPITDSEPKPRK